MGGDMRVDYPGLMRERLPSGNFRWRVRKEGDRAIKTAIPFGPEHPDFVEYYHAARAGRKLPPPASETAPDRGTNGWLFNAYLANLGKLVEAGHASPLTLKERRSLARFVGGQKSEQAKSEGKQYRDLPAPIPAPELIAFKDRMHRTPGKARNVWKFLRAAYDFGLERGHIRENTARSVRPPVYRSGGGATAWTVEDLKAYREAHPPGTTAHLALTLFMFTACRISDACRLGPGNEIDRDGVLWLRWTPGKKGSSIVEIPVLPPLERAIRQAGGTGPTYLTTMHGAPFATPEALRNRMQKWCATAGLKGRSSHGIRKAAGHFLALQGATQYEIMAIHGHANAQTSEVYTKAVERMRLGEMAAGRLGKIDW